MTVRTLDLSPVLARIEPRILQPFEEKWLQACIPNSEFNHAISIPVPLLRELYCEVLSLGPEHSQVMSLVRLLEIKFLSLPPTKFIDYGDNDLVDSIVHLFLGSEIRMSPQLAESKRFNPTALSFYSRAIQMSIYGGEKTSSEVVRVRYAVAHLSESVCELLPPCYNVYSQSNKQLHGPSDVVTMVEGMLWALVGPGILHDGARAERIRPFWEGKVLEWMEENA